MYRDAAAEETAIASIDCDERPISITPMEEYRAANVKNDYR